MTDLVHIETTGPIATITLNRPQRHNSLVPELLAGLHEALVRAANDVDVRAIVLQANGPSFSTGGDVAAICDAGDDVARYAAEIVGLLNETMLAMFTTPQPIVTAVHGIVTGGSLGLVLASDIVLIAPGAGITPWYSVVGFSPDGGWTALLPQLIGRARTMSLLAENGTMAAEDAVAWGVASRLVPRSSIRAEARRTAETIAVHRASSIRAAKRLVRPAIVAVSDGLERERLAFVAQIATKEARSGMADYLGERD
jgi:enoyl-CoA hydratase/carnithine racemase